MKIQTLKGADLTEEHVGRRATVIDCVGNRFRGVIQPRTPGQWAQHSSRMGLFLDRSDDCNLPEGYVSIIFVEEEVELEVGK